MAITCSTVNDLFSRETNRFSVDVHERYSVDGPWGRLVRVGKFPQGMGTTLTEITVERVINLVGLGATGLIGSGAMITDILS
jgi:hypothetical protein